MSSEEIGRRRSHVQMPVAYAAVGASKAPDLLRFPPEGMTPYEETHRLGSGQDRFITASSLLMTWGAQRGAGISVTEVIPGTGAQYSGPSFDEEGRPQAAGSIEQHYGPQGEPYILAGTKAKIQLRERAQRSILVVYTVDEDRRVGFAWGLGDELGAVGEQLFYVEHRDDDTVWAVARGFLAAANSGVLGFRGRADMKAALDAVKLQIAALAPGGAGVAPAAPVSHLDEEPASTQTEPTVSAGFVPLPGESTAPMEPNPDFQPESSDPVTAEVELPQTAADPEESAGAGLAADPAPAADAEPAPDPEPAPDSEPEPAPQTEQVSVEPQEPQQSEASPEPPAGTRPTHQRRPSRSL